MAFWADSMGLLGGVKFVTASLNWFPILSALGGAKLLLAKGFWILWMGFTFV